MASSKKIKDVFEFLRRIKVSSAMTKVEGASTVSTLLGRRKFGYDNCHYYTSGHRGSQLIGVARTSPKDSAKLVSDNGSKLSPGSPPPPWWSIFRHWGALILGFLATVALPFWNKKWEQIRTIAVEAEVVIEEIDKVAKVVEKVAAVTERVSEEIAGSLPENSKLQKTALAIENLSKVATVDVATAENIIQKVEVLKHDFQDLEKAVKPVITKTHSDEHTQ